MTIIILIFIAFHSALSIYILWRSGRAEIESIDRDIEAQESSLKIATMLSVHFKMHHDEIKKEFDSDIPSV